MFWSSVCAAFDWIKRSPHFASRSGGACVPWPGVCGRRSRRCQFQHIHYVSGGPSTQCLDPFEPGAAAPCRLFSSFVISSSSFVRLPHPADPAATLSPTPRSTHRPPPPPLPPPPPRTTRPRPPLTPTSAAL